ncbi:tetratricopeptide (TPR) repeat protein [Rhodoblastus acidophilus]|nr:tetratricopeptide repeat protein [Rhodoblastus acidophilus]MCW2273407.1 tetratricopeptide (TPR) repeat protein [Rhodoblastus acidophilus]
MSIKIFLSTVSDEFRAYRDLLRRDLTRHNVEVKVQEDFVDLGGDTLDKLDVYIAECDAVVHLVGDMTGATPGAREQATLLRKHPDLPKDLPPLAEAFAGAPITYTQWEAWLALHRQKLLLIAKPDANAPRDKAYAPTEQSRAAQKTHLARLEAVRRYPGCVFANADQLATYVFRSGILDPLVQDYAAQEAQARQLAEGFIREMAQRVAADKTLDLEGMQQAVRNAIDIYEKEIAGGVQQSNTDDIVTRALQQARNQFDAGKSRLAQETLRRAMEDMRQERDRCEQGVKTLGERRRDMALAAYDGEAAAQAIIEMAEALHGDHHQGVWEELTQQEDALTAFGSDQGSNVHLVAAIGVNRHLERIARTPDEKGYAHNSHGIAAGTLGERESGAAHLEQAVVAYRAALDERKRERVPLDWATTQNNLGNALRTLGERETGTARLEQAVAAFHAALQEHTRERFPLDWAMTQVNLGNALATLGERESGTARLEQAVAAYRAALEKWTRERVPLQWATTQNNLGSALNKLGERESGTARLEQAVAAYRAALEEWTRKRVPLNWATTQNNLGNALTKLGERESGTARLEQAVAAYRAALEERTRERVPLQWATTQNNLGITLKALGERESGMARLEQAVAAFLAALEERTRERVPLQWAMTQNNLGNALAKLGERESGATRLEQAVAAYCAALDVYTHERARIDWAMTQNNLGVALQTLGARENGTARLEQAVAAYSAALAECTRERVPLDWANSIGNQGSAMALLAERTSDGALASRALTQLETGERVLREGGHEAWSITFRRQLPKAKALVARLSAPQSY